MSGSSRPMRADAIRNRSKILAAARGQIAMHGPEVGMDAIAAEAGVAVGTLYRHFPMKADLVSAVLVEYEQQMAREAVDALSLAEEGGDPLTVLVDFIHGVLRASAENAAAKAATPAFGAVIDIEESGAAAALAQLIALGIAEGSVRDDLSVADVYLLVSSAPLEQAEVVLQRWAELVLPALTASSARIRLPTT